MPADIREYLLERFSSDAVTLRQRAESLASANKPSPGPNAALSMAMANACDHVVSLAQELPEHAPVDVIVDALRLLVPKLTLLANGGDAASNPAIRSVYVGACTRVQELIAAEASAAANRADDAAADDDGDEDFATDLESDFDSDDDELDDDDVDDDELQDDWHDDSHGDSHNDESRDNER